MIETIKIVIDHERGYKIINKDDFDPKVDKEYKPKATRKPRKTKEKE